MKKVCLLISHEHSDSKALLNVLSNNPRLSCYNTGRVYNHALSLEELTALPHKIDNVAAIWMEMLLHNYQFSCKSLYPICKFIYMIREAEPTLNALVESGYRPDAALRYYTYRLRRICEMARCTPGAVLLTWQDIKLPLIESYLNLKQPLELPVLSKVKTGLVKWPLVEEGQKCYERYLFFLKNQAIAL